MRSLIRCGLILVALFTLSACGGKTAETARGGATAEDFSPVLAEVGGIPITRNYFDYRYENLSAMDKARYTGEGWEQRFLDTLVEEYLVVSAAEEEKLDLVRETAWRLQIAHNSVLYGAFHAKHFSENVVVPEEEIVAAYESSPELYRNSGRMTAQHIMCSTKDKIDAAWRELQGGEHWSRVCAKYTEDTATVEGSGSLGWFNPDGYVIGMGFNKEFTDFAFSLEEHTLAPPVQIGDAWHIVRTGAKYPGEVQPLDDVRERIARSIRPGIAKEQYETSLREMKADQGVRYFGEFAQEERRSAEALYKIAAETRDPHAKLDFYGRVVELYPEHELADESLFMQGFVYSEQFGDVPGASRCFRRLKRDYPESEYVADADWMLQNLGRAVPELTGDGLPASAEEANARIKEQNN